MKKGLDKLEKRIIKCIRKLAKYLGRKSTFLSYKDISRYGYIISDAKAMYADPRIFKSDDFNRCRGNVCKELDVRFSSIYITYEYDSFFKKPPIRVEFQYEYNRYTYTVCSTHNPFMNKYDYEFSSESAPDPVNKSLGEMLSICMIIELYSILRFTHPTKYRGEKLHEII